MEDVCEGKDFNFPKQEEKILEMWEAIDAFQTQLKKTEGKPEYVFFDGPPFATGLPHYGHILAGTIKDIVTRYQTARGHHVTRRFGWDCHGLPVEFEIDTKLGIKSRDDVLAMGIDKYNEECRSIVMRYSKEWEKIITRVGRWIDFENDYKTLDPQFMESVWWVFEQLWNKDLVYRGFKVMPYSTGCKTPLSNFEAGLNYKDVPDPAIMVSFPLKDEAFGGALVAWTTTPWTLPSNLALCVNATFNYVKVRCKATGAIYIVAESRLSQLLVKKTKADVPNGTVKKTKDLGTKAGGKQKGIPEEKVATPLDSSSYEVLETFKGSALVGKKYQPLFDYFLELSDTAFIVVADNYVTDDSGTGVVHCAPAFGEDDYRVCSDANIVKKGEDLLIPVDANGCFVEKVADFKGRYVKDADKDIISAVKAKGRLVSSGSIMHSYPFCWRSETPLLYRAVPSWFVAVEKIKDQLLENNKQTTWVPDYVKEKRFHNWLENARDWAISRSRFWGTPLPVWVSDDGEEKVVVGSIEKLEELSGVKVTDLHRHKIDHITIPSGRGPNYGVLRRVDDVFDCWFESGSMPYAYIHYPFENKKIFENNFPGHFVAEGLDQTRGWFYTLMVLSTALFGKPAFRNLICNGLVLAEDGKKMSKRLKNYPPPMEVVNNYGAVQYPGLQQRLRVDIKTMGILSHAISWIFPDYQFEWIVPEFEKTLSKELDFLQEAENAERTARNFRKHKSVKVPHIFWDFTTRQVLTMEFMHGCKIDDLHCLLRSGLNPKKVAQTLVEVFAEMIFVHGYVHGDPHPGNILVFPRSSKNHSFDLVLLDHGIYRELDERFRVDFCQLWKALILLDQHEMQQMGERLGVGKYYQYLPVIFTGRTIDSKSGLGKSMPIEERKRLSQEVRQFTMGDISQFMESLPRDLLTVLRTDGLLRSIISKLGAPQRVRLMANAKYAVAGLVPKYNSEPGFSLKPTAKATFDYIYLRLCLEVLELHYKMRGIYASLLKQFKYWFSKFVGYLPTRITLPNLVP